MKVTEFIRRKNAILFDITGITLVPEDQIEEVEAKPLTKNWTNGGLCPYCRLYNQLDDIVDCSQCIMSKRGNECNGINSTYKQIIKALSDNYMLISFERIPKVKALISEYNKQFIKRS
jgi:hypothetical protein